MSHHVTLFRFKLGKGQSIGPKELRRIWADACRTSDVSVSRSNYDAGYSDDTHTYSLLGSPKTPNLAEVERRMQRMLAELSPTATIRLTPL